MLSERDMGEKEESDQGGGGKTKREISRKSFDENVGG